MGQGNAKLKLVTNTSQPLQVARGLVLEALIVHPYKAVLVNTKGLLVAQAYN
jgi:hypothetical protein